MTGIGTPLPLTPSALQRELLEAGIDLAREHLHALHGLFVFEVARLSHDEQVAVS